MLLPREQHTHDLKRQHAAKGLASAPLEKTNQQNVLPEVSYSVATLGKPWWERSGMCQVLTRKLSKQQKRTAHFKCQEPWQQDSIHTGAPWSLPAPGVGCFSNNSVPSIITYFISKNISKPKMGYNRPAQANTGHYTDLLSDS